MATNLTGGVENTHSGGEPISFLSGYVPPPSTHDSSPPVQRRYFQSIFPNQSKTRLNSDPRIKVEVNSTDVPSSIVKNIMKYDPNFQITEEDENKGATAPPDKYSNLPHSPNSLFEFRNAKERAQYEIEMKSEEVQQRFKKNKSSLKKFSSNF